MKAPWKDVPDEAPQDVPDETSQKDVPDEVLQKDMPDEGSPDECARLWQMKAFKKDVLDESFSEGCAGQAPPERWIFALSVYKRAGKLVVSVF